MHKWLSHLVFVSYPFVDILVLLSMYCYLCTVTSVETAEEMLTKEARQLPSGKRGLFMISGPSSDIELHVWEPLITDVSNRVSIHVSEVGVYLMVDGASP